MTENTTSIALALAGLAESVGAVVVHHRNYPEVLDTVDGILAQGIRPENVVLVDNTEDDEITMSLKENLADGVRLLTVENQGFAAGVNRGALQLDTEFVLVATHEVTFGKGAVRLLHEALLSHPEAAVVGPTLDGWSSGGYLTRWWLWPKHYQLSPHRQTGATPTVPRAWLDGAACLYRASALEHRMREEFFMYGEELEFHIRLRALGQDVLWVPRASAQQHTSGMPAYYQTRSQQILVRLWGNWLQRVWSTPLLILRMAVASPMKLRRYSLRDAWRGWRDGKRQPIRR